MYPYVSVPEADREASEHESDAPCDDGSDRDEHDDDDVASTEDQESEESDGEGDNDVEVVVDPAFNPELNPDNQLGVYPEKYPPAASSDESDGNEGHDSEPDENSVDNGTTLVLGDDDIAPLADIPSGHEAEDAGVHDGETLVTPPKRAATDDAVAA